MKSTRNLIFDLDGTLIDSSRGVVESVNYALRCADQAEQPAEIIKPYIGYPLRQMFADFSSVSGDLLYRHFQVKAAEVIVSSAEPLSGVEETLEELYRRGYRMSIATTKIRAHLDGILDKLEWNRYFGSTVSGSDVSSPKPDPSAILLAMERLDCSANSTVMIGDTVNDILASQAAKVKVVAVPNPYGAEENEKVARLTPDYSLSNIRELLDILPELDRG